MPRMRMRKEAIKRAFARRAHARRRINIINALPARTVGIGLIGAGGAGLGGMLAALKRQL